MSSHAYSKLPWLHRAFQNRHACRKLERLQFEVAISYEDKLSCSREEANHRYSDCLDLHCTTEEVRGRPGEPVARLTPLGWACVGNPYNSDTPILQTHFAYTYFMRDESEIQQLDVNLKRFWEFEETPSVNSAPIVQIHEQCALKKVNHSVEYDNAMYRIGVPWIDSRPILPDNYHMTLQRLQNTEKRLQKSPDVAMAYSDIIDKLCEKGSSRRALSIALVLTTLSSS